MGCDKCCVCGRGGARPATARSRCRAALRPPASRGARQTRAAHASSFSSSPILVPAARNAWWRTPPKSWPGAASMLHLLVFTDRADAYPIDPRVTCHFWSPRRGNPAPAEPGEKDGDSDTPWPDDGQAGRAPIVPPLGARRDRLRHRAGPDLGLAAANDPQARARRRALLSHPNQHIDACSRRGDFTSTPSFPSATILACSAIDPASR